MARASRYDEVAPKVLEQIANAEARHAKPPSVRGLADSFGVAVATLHSYLTRLAKEGLIEWRTARHRSLKLTEAGRARHAAGW